MNCLLLQQPGAWMSHWYPCPVVQQHLLLSPLAAGFRPEQAQVSRQQRPMSPVLTLTM